MARYVGGDSGTQSNYPSVVLGRDVYMRVLNIIWKEFLRAEREQQVVQAHKRQAKLRVGPASRRAESAIRLER